MQQVIIHTLNIGTELNSVNAEDLHLNIQAKSKFADWIVRRIKKYGFIENKDYIKIIRKVGNATAYDYFITLDVAKELCMVENNEKGREARRYFIEAEKQLVNQPDLQKILNQIEKQNQEIQNLKNQLSLKEPKLIEKPINPFKGFYDNFAPRERENEFAYTRKDWMLLLSECERVLVEERKNKRQLLLSRGGGL